MSRDDYYYTGRSEGRAGASRAQGARPGGPRKNSGKNTARRKYSSGNARRKKAPQRGRGGRGNGGDFDLLTFFANLPQNGKIAIAAGAAAIILFGVYLWGRGYYGKHFLPNTIVNGVEVDKLTAEEASGLLPYSMPTITIQNGGVAVDQFNLADIGGSYSFDKQLQNLIDEQPSGKWIFVRGKVKEHNIEPDLGYDVSKIRSIVESLDIVQNPDATLPQDAYIAKTDSGFEIVPEQPGTKINPELLVQTVTDDLSKWIYQIDATDSLEKPKVVASDLSLTDEMVAISNYNYIGINMSGGAFEKMDKATAMSLLNYDGKETITVDEAGVRAYIAEIAKEYNTLGTVRTFRTHDGTDIQVGGSDKDTFGYKMDQETTAERVIGCLKTGRDTSAKWPVAGFARTDRNDFGSTYVEVSIAKQHLWYYVGGNVVLETDVVTGTGVNSTTPGVFMILNKESPAVLTGPGYATDVTYWMPITYTGTGLHDATWRTEFGQEVYISGGSHGCVNMPLEEVEKLYNMIEMGTPVIIY